MENEFLEKYKALCLEYGMQLRGCGDCGSAWLDKLNEEELRNAKLTWQGAYERVQFADNYALANMENFL